MDGFILARYAAPSPKAVEELIACFDKRRGPLL